MSKTLRDLQEKLSKNMPKAVAIANRNTNRDNQGHIVLPKDDEWGDENEYETNQSSTTSFKKEVYSNVTSM